MFHTGSRNFFAPKQMVVTYAKVVDRVIDKMIQYLKEGKDCFW